MLPPRIFLSCARGADVGPFDPATSFGARLHADLTTAARERLVKIVGPKAALSDCVRQECRTTLQADKAVTLILRQGDYHLVHVELKLHNGENSGMTHKQ